MKIVLVILCITLLKNAASQRKDIEDDMKDEKYTAYEDWSECTASCGGGISFRVKECVGLTGEKDCEKSESKACNTHSCDDDNTGTYSEWSECTASCGGGIKFRTRNCRQQTKKSTCEESESVSCNEEKCPELTKKKMKEYVDYSEWSECTVTCGGGFSFRVRECTELNGDPGCEKSERKPCNEIPCDGVVAEELNLGGKMEDRKESLKDVKKINQAGKMKEYVNYSEWSECTVTCGGGFSFRVLECIGLTGDVDCEKSERKPCNEQLCPEETNVENEDVINTIAKENTKPGKKSSGHARSLSIDTLQVPEEVISKELTIPTEENEKKYVDYSEWSECTVTCGGGLSFRTRECSDLSGDEDCEKSESKPCNEELCETHIGPKFLIFTTMPPTSNNNTDSVKEIGAPEQIQLLDIVEGEVGGREIPILTRPPTSTTTLRLTTKLTTARTIPISEPAQTTETTKSMVTTRRPKVTTGCREVIQAGKRAMQFVPQNLRRKNKFNCEWIFKAPRGKQVMAEIRYSNIENCCDEFKVYDGAKNLKMVTGKSSFNNRYRTKSGRLRLTFKTPGATGFRNFRVFYVQYPVSDSPNPTPRPTTTQLSTTTSEITTRAVTANLCHSTVFGGEEIKTIDSNDLDRYNDQECVWKIKSGNGGRVKTRIIYYSTSPCCSFMEVYDGEKLLKRYSGNMYNRGEDFESSTGTLSIIYKHAPNEGKSRVRVFYRTFAGNVMSSSSGENQGRQTSDHTEQASKHTSPTSRPEKAGSIECGGLYRAKKEVKMIVGPHFQEGKAYDCEWKIRAPQGSTIKTMIYFYNTVDNGDSLQVLDNRRMLAKISGKIYRENEYVTATNILKLRYVSQGGNGARRFRAVFKLNEERNIPVVTTRPSIHQRRIKSPECGNVLVATNYVRQMKSPHFMAGQSYDCEWKIVAPVGRRLQVQLEYCNDVQCCDTMKVKEGNVLIDEITKDTFSHTKYFTKSDSLTLHFTSEGGDGLRHFTIFYKVEPEEMKLSFPSREHQINRIQNRRQRRQRQPHIHRHNGW
ncbi:uncharacterized protein LOC120345106 isoform X2 [Styela clava]